MYHGRHIGCDGGDCVAGGDVKKINNAGDEKKKKSVPRFNSFCLCTFTAGIRVCTITINRVHTHVA